MLVPEKIQCPLCRSEKLREFSRDRRRDYNLCDVCGLVSVPPRQFLSPEDEKKRYDLHRNSPDDPGYRSFLNRLFSPLNQRLEPGSSGLDFGSGPMPALAMMFRDAGHSITLFDHFYAPDSEVLKRQYDFITASEVVEHLRNPQRQLELLWSCLKPGGWLGIMTKPVVGQDEFPAWHYKNDLTHVCFFSPATFTWLARLWNAELTFADRDVVLFHKKTSEVTAGTC